MANLMAKYFQIMVSFAWLPIEIVPYLSFSGPWPALSRSEDEQ